MTSLWTWLFRPKRRPPAKPAPAPAARPTEPAILRPDVVEGPEGGTSVSLPTAAPAPGAMAAAAVGGAFVVGVEARDMMREEALGRDPGRAGDGPAEATEGGDDGGSSGDATGVATAGDGGTSEGGDAGGDGGGD